MTNFDTNFKIELKGLGRDYGEYKEKISESKIQIWKDIIKNFSMYSYKNQDEVINLKFNWEPALIAARNEYKYNLTLSEIKNLGIPFIISPATNINSDLWEYAMIECNASIISDIIPNVVRVRRLKNYIENFLYMIFILSNLCSPGSCEFKNVLIQNTEFPEISEKINLSGVAFDGAWICSLDNKWPFIDYIPLIRAINWYNNLNLGTKQIANTSVEKSIFALLNYASKEDSVGDIINLIWLSYAIESIYDTPVSSISQVLKDRIFLVLGNPKNEINKFKKKIIDFYNLRSRITHGDAEIVHPSFNDLFDDRIDDYLMVLADNSEFALSVLISTFQKMINENLTELKFIESLKKANY